MDLSVHQLSVHQFVRLLRRAGMPDAAAVAAQTLHDPVTTAAGQGPSLSGAKKWPANWLPSATKWTTSGRTLSRTDAKASVMGGSSISR